MQSPPLLSIDQDRTTVVQANVPGRDEQRTGFSSLPCKPCAHTLHPVRQSSARTKVQRAQLPERAERHVRVNLQARVGAEVQAPQQRQAGHARRQPLQALAAHRQDAQLPQRQHLPGDQLLEKRGWRMHAGKHLHRGIMLWCHYLSKKYYCSFRGGARNGPGVTPFALLVCEAAAAFEGTPCRTLNAVVNAR